MSNNKNLILSCFLAAFMSSSFAQVKDNQASGKIVNTEKIDTASAYIAPITHPTLGELAEQQRQKQLAEIIKAREDALATAKAKKASELAAKAAVVSLKPVKPLKNAKAPAPLPPPPQNILHSTFALKGVWHAEIYDGQLLSKVKVGQLYKGLTVSRIDASGVQAGSVSVALGGRF